RAPREAGDLLSYHRLHRATHEVEVHHGEVERHPVQTTVAGPDRLERTRLSDRQLEALLVALEGEGIGGAQLAVQLVPGSLVHEQVDVFLGRNAAMVTAVGANVERADEPVLDVDVAARVAFFPGIGWNLPLHPFGRARFALFFEPGHSRHRG